MRKRSFFEKLTGAVRVDDFDDELMDEESEEQHVINNSMDNPANNIYEEEPSVPAEEGQLSVDVINTQEDIIIKAMVAGVKPQDMDVEISRDMVTIHGTREEQHDVNEEDYYHKELYWGSFSRNILLPEEIDVELAEAKEKHGLLVLRLPKLDKDRKTKLPVKTG